MRRSAFYALAALTITALTFPLSGCNDNTTTAAGPDSVIPPVPVVHATPVTGAVRADLDEPLTDPLWQQARWNPLTTALSSRSATPATRCAFLFDASTLYVALVSHQPAPDAESADEFSIYLDPHGLENEARRIDMLEISVDLSPSAGGEGLTPAPRFSWFRCVLPARSLPGGMPDLSLPIDHLPDLKLTGIWCEMRDVTDNETPARTAVVAIPSRSLPGPLRAAPGTAPWKINVVRTSTPSGDRKLHQQSNLSPVHPGTQHAAPYRMAELQFAK